MKLEFFGKKINVVRGISWISLIFSLPMLYGCAGVAGVAVVGASYQHIQANKDKVAFPPTGKIYQVQGKNMHLDCRGQGSPTVVLEAGLTGTVPKWNWKSIHDDIAKVTQVCAYDRPGLGWSEPAGAFNADANSERLHQLLQTAEVTGGLILVGSSIGGIYIRNYHHHFPGRIVGMVLIDSSHERQLNRLPDRVVGRNRYLWAMKPGCLVAYPFGIVRAFKIGAGRLQNVDKNIERYNLAQAYRTNTCLDAYYELKELLNVSKQTVLPKDLGDLPLVVLTANPWYNPEDMRDIWSEMQADLLSLSSNGKQYIAPKSGHTIADTQPELVVEKVIELVEEIRN